MVSLSQRLAKIRRRIERRSAGPPVSITEGDIRRAVWALAWPTVLTNILWSGTGLINVFFVGNLGKSALAIVGRSEQVVFLLMSIVTSVAVGTSALVARFIGASERKEAEEVSRQSLVMSVLGGVLAAILLWYGCEPILRLLQTDSTQMPESIRYLRILAWVQLPVFLMIVIGAIFRGLGDSRTPMYIMLTTNLLQVIGDWVFIYGAGPFAAIGVVGAAYSWLVSRMGGVVLSFVFLWRSPMPGALRGSWLPIRAWFMRIWAIGIPTAIQQTIRMTGSMVFLSFLGALPNGTASVATLTLGMRIESIAFMPGFAYSMAAITMVGQNLGAGKPDRAERSGWVCSWQAMFLMGIAGVAFLTLPVPILRIFTRDAEVIALGTGYLMANAVAQPMMSFGVALSGALQGAGETRVPAWVTFLTMWVVRVPLTYLLALRMGFGTISAWGVMAATNILYGILITYLFRQGRWKEKEI